MPWNPFQSPTRVKRAREQALTHARNIIAGSVLFDPLWYSLVNTDARASGSDEAMHYLLKGAQEGKNPSLYFDSLRYLQAYPDVRSSGINPLVHYETYGRKEGRTGFGQLDDVPLDPRLPQIDYSNLNCTLTSDSPTNAITNPRGVRVYVNPYDSRGKELLANGGFLNQPTLDAWQLLIREQPWTHVLDIGANYGEMLFTAEFPQHCLLYAFEPSPLVLPYLKRSLTEASLNIRVSRLAMSNRNKIAELCLDPNWSGLTGFARPGQDSSVAAKASVQTTTLSEILPTIGSLPEMLLLMKIDVEGHEIAVLEGLERSLPLLKDMACLIEVLHMGDHELGYILSRYHVDLYYKNTRRLEKFEGDGAQQLRSTLGSPGVHFQDVIIRRR